MTGRRIHRTPNSLLEHLESRTLFSADIPTSTSLIASTTALSVGETLTFTATVTAENSSLNGQWVQIWDNHTLFVGSAQLTSNSATINWTPRTGGLHSLSAEFPAQDNFQQSLSSDLFLNVFRHAASISLNSSTLP